MTKYKEYGVILTRKDRDGKDEDVALLIIYTNKEGAQRNAKIRKSELSKEDRKYGDKVIARVLKASDAELIARFKLKSYKNNIIEDLKYLEHKLSWTSGLGAYHELDRVRGILGAVESLFAQPNKVTLDDLENWPEFEKIEVTSKSDESISTYSHTSCWSTSYKVIIPLTNGKVLEGSYISIGSVNRV